MGLTASNHQWPLQRYTWDRAQKLQKSVILPVSMVPFMPPQSNGQWHCWVSIMQRKVICLSFSFTKFSKSFLVNSKASFGRSYIPNSLYMMWPTPLDQGIRMDPRSHLQVYLKFCQENESERNNQECNYAFDWSWNCHVFTLGLTSKNPMFVVEIFTCIIVLFSLISC